MELWQTTKEELENFRSYISQDQYKVLELRIEGKQYKEIAEILGVRNGTIKSRINRAKEKILRKAGIDFGKPKAAGMTQAA